MILSNFTFLTIVYNSKYLGYDKGYGIIITPFIDQILALTQPEGEPELLSDKEIGEVETVHEHYWELDLSDLRAIAQAQLDKDIRWMRGER